MSDISKFCKRLKDSIKKNDGKLNEYFSDFGKTYYPGDSLRIKAYSDKNCIYVIEDDSETILQENVSLSLNSNIRIEVTHNGITEAPYDTKYSEIIKHVSKKTISVLMCKRVEYGRQVLQHIKDAVGSEDWKVYVYCDVPGHQTDVPYRRSKVKVNPKAVYDMVKSFDFVEDVMMAPKPLGLKAATQWALNHVFRVRNSDYNLHVEDDVLLSPDALKYVEQCYPYLNDKIGSATLVGYLDDSNPSFEERIKVTKHVWFNCGWGWAMKHDFFINNFNRAPEVGHAASWAANINQLFKDEGFYELRSLARKSKNIGRDFPTHMMSKDNGLNCKDVRDDWNGGSHGPVWEWDFSALDDCS